jgi:hypothetical protein
LAGLGLRLLCIAIEHVGNGFQFVPALKAELRKIADKAIGEGLALKNYRDEERLRALTSLG